MQQVDTTETAIGIEIGDAPQGDDKITEEVGLMFCRLNVVVLHPSLLDDITCFIMNK